mmetsp:Transcript_26938/g.41441  ORF Transcript_26938/g.41441 Transcript_26938/m.41441 type:complete len:208 (+) Transcript_26938:908-1531(+)
MHHNLIENNHFIVFTKQELAVSHWMWIIWKIEAIPLIDANAARILMIAAIFVRECNWVLKHLPNLLSFLAIHDCSVISSLTCYAKRHAVFLICVFVCINYCINGIRLFRLNKLNFGSIICIIISRQHLPVGHRPILILFPRSRRRDNVWIHRDNLSIIQEEDIVAIKLGAIIKVEREPLMCSDPCCSVCVINVILIHFTYNDGCIFI